jgi:acyl phosphate:glycerol-3-phosphate acyltransferase
MSSILFYLLAFFVGAIPFAYLYGKLIHNTDIRQQGSGNSGATNSLRVFGKKAGAIVLLADVLKGLIPVLLAKSYLDDQGFIIIGLAAILGHVFSPFLSFKGGKGIATSLGVAFGASLPAAGVCVLVFGLVVYFTRMVSLGSILGAFAFLIFNVFYTENQNLTYLSIGLFILILFTHRKNILLILQNKENRI